MHHGNMLWNSMPMHPRPQTPRTTLFCRLKIHLCVPWRRSSEFPKPVPTRGPRRRSGNCMRRLPFPWDFTEAIIIIYAPADSGPCFIRIFSHLITDTYHYVILLTTNFYFWRHNARQFAVYTMPPFIYSGNVCAYLTYYILYYYSEK